MSETAQHQTEGQDASLNAISALSILDLGALSFVQLKRLEKMLRQACDDVAAESERRTNEDHSGDTVKVASPNL